jgi:DNA topoisomerase I
VKHGSTNANVPRGADPASVTMEQAVELLAARAAKGPAKKGGFKRGGAKKAAKG